MRNDFIISVYIVFIRKAPASYNEYQNIKQQLEVETVPGANPGDPPKPFHSLHPQEQAKMSKKRLAGKSYCTQLHQILFYLIFLLSDV